MAATTLGKAVGHCAHCAGHVHAEPSLAFYQTAAAVFAVLLLTGVVGEIRDIRARISAAEEVPRTVWRYLFAITTILVFVMGGELVSLLTLLESPSSPEKWQQIVVGVCLFLSVLGIPLLALLSVAESRLKELTSLLRLRELAWIGRAILTLLLAALLAVGLHLVFTAFHRNPSAHRYHVFGTCVAGSCGLNERLLPRADSTKLGLLHDGDTVEIVCQVPGGKVTTPEGVSSRTWDRLVNGHYVSDVSVDTPRIGSRIPACLRHSRERRTR